MTPQEIIENNTLLAEFLGSEIEETLRGEKVYCLLLPDENDLSGFKKEFFAPDELKFHKDWNWLMYVVKEVMKKANQKFTDEEFDMYLENSLAIADINELYTCCIECVKWFNQNKGGN